MIKKTHHSIVWSNPNTKRKKRRMKLSGLFADCLKSPRDGLTASKARSILKSSISRLTGSRNPFSVGVKTPQPIAAFLCPVISIMAGCLGQPLRLAAPMRGFSTPFQPVAHDVEIMIGGLSSLALETA